MAIVKVLKRVEDDELIFVSDQGIGYPFTFSMWKKSTWSQAEFAAGLYYGSPMQESDYYGTEDITESYGLPQ